MASPAAITVRSPFTASLLSQLTRGCNSAPIKLSIRHAKNATAVISGIWPAGISFRAQPTAEKSSEPARLARVPSKLTAPSVPGGTGFHWLRLTVLRPQRLPISLPKVSPSLAAKLATNPLSSNCFGAPGSRVARASSAPVAAEPHTFSGPLLPPRASAMPRDSFLGNPSLVTAYPKAKYNTTAHQPRQPMLAASRVPRHQAWNQPALVNRGRRCTKRINKPLIRALARAPVSQPPTAWLISSVVLL